jgi:hypothetical protein
MARRLGAGTSTAGVPVGLGHARAATSAIAIDLAIYTGAVKVTDTALAPRGW